MKLSVLDDLLWAAGFLSGLALIVVVLWRARWKRFPIFTLWIAFVTGKSALSYLIYRFSGWGHLYAQVFWISLWPEFLLQIGTAAELARAALRRKGKWVGDAGKLLLIAGGFGILASALLCEWIVPPHGAYASWALRGDLFSSLVVCELLVCIGLLANWLGLAWERHSLTLMQGLTALSVVCLEVNALQSYFGTRNFRQIEYFQSYAWIGATVWIAIEFASRGSEHGFPERQPAPEPQAGGQNPSRLPRPLPLQRPSAFLLFLPQAARFPGRIFRPSSSANSIDGATE